jgi:biotin-(acetyl-CoA carboxylase) ligase
LHVGVAVVQLLNHWGCAAQLKWPNDIVIASPLQPKSALASSLATAPAPSPQLTHLQHAKLAGILVETRKLDAHTTAVVVGLGLNWHSAPALADRPTSCVSAHWQPGAAAPTSEQCCTALISAMALAWQRCVEQQPCDFAAHDALRGQTITVLSEHTNEQAGEPINPLLNQQGVAQGINAQGHLGVLLSSGQTVWLHSGEVSIRQAVV